MYVNGFNVPISIVIPLDDRYFTTSGSHPSK